MALTTLCQLNLRISKLTNFQFENLPLIRNKYRLHEEVRSKPRLNISLNMGKMAAKKQPGNFVICEYLYPVERKMG